MNTPAPATWRQQAVALVACLAVAFATGAIGSIASITASSFYATLDRPSWAPPAGVFGPVWTVLYVTIGVAMWLVWREGPGTARRTAAGWWLAQLAANALWSWLFFGWHLGAWAFAEVLLLWALIVATLVAFARVRPLAAWLLLPYLSWVTFASALTWSVWQRNPGALG